MKKDRKKCVLCESTSLTEIFKLRMPLFMGVNNNNSTEYIDDMTFLKCNICHEVQIKELIDLEILYNSNHNIGVIGETWKNHYIEISKFIQEDIKEKTILEISDPSAKIAKLSKNFKEWIIVEPNPEEVQPENVTIIKTFFDDDFKIDKQIDVIIHSHLLEHIHDPHSFFKKCHDVLSENGKMFISVPDMEFLAVNKYSPNNILHFEHTYYLDMSVLEYLAKQNGFEITRLKKYNDHSIFYELSKSIITDIELKSDTNFKELLENQISNMDSINQLMDYTENYKIYIFGAHVSSQFYLFNGLKNKKIIGVLDNSKEKQGYNLYGTKLLTYDPSIIENDEKCIVICSHTGIYHGEISKQLRKINKNVIIL